MVYNKILNKYNLFFGRIWLERLLRMEQQAFHLSLAITQAMFSLFLSLFLSLSISFTLLCLTDDRCTHSEMKRNFIISPQPSLAPLDRWVPSSTINIIVYVLALSLFLSLFCEKLRQFTRGGKVSNQEFEFCTSF
jgi:hypothetical protein